MSETTGSDVQAKQLLQKIMDTAIAVITKPTEFYRGMAKTGGFGDPLVFMVVMGTIAGVVQAVLAFVHLIPFFSVITALAAIIYFPIAMVIGGFIGAAIMFVIWKLMGSNESYERPIAAAPTRPPSCPSPRFWELSPILVRSLAWPGCCSWW